MPGIKYREILESLPPTLSNDLRQDLRESFDGLRNVFIIVDDDPTGNQTVHDIPILSDWSVEILTEEFRKGSPAFYILANTRSLDEAAARERNSEIGRNISLVSKKLNKTIGIVSRSDSTLRGHHPAEVEELRKSLGLEEAINIIIPAMFEGGRCTIGDIHYMREGEYLIPVSESPFAKDPDFAYHHSDLKEWVEEKTKGKHKAADVHSISLEDIRIRGESYITEKILNIEDGGVCILNAVDYSDMDAACMAIHGAERAGKKIIYRTSSSFIPSYLGLEHRGLLQKSELSLNNKGGLIVVGSFVPKTTIQLEYLMSNSDVKVFEINVPELLEGRLDEKQVSAICRSIDLCLEQGEDVVLYTSRELVKSEGSTGHLDSGRIISGMIVRIVRSLTCRPSYIIAKGGITSNYLAVEALGINRCIVKGQIMPAVPLWVPGEGTRFPGISFVVFPGNVGTEDFLLKIVEKLS